MFLREQVVGTCGQVTGRSPCPAPTARDKQYLLDVRMNPGQKHLSVTLLIVPFPTTEFLKEPRGEALCPCEKVTFS